MVLVAPSVEEARLLGARRFAAKHEFETRLSQVAAGLVVAGWEHRAAGVREINLALAVRDQDAVRAQEVHAEDHLRLPGEAAHRRAAADLVDQGLARQV